MACTLLVRPVVVAVVSAVVAAVLLVGIALRFCAASPFALFNVIQFH